ncbi:hypothetical protein JSCD8_35020 [Clostridioides difficile]|nr:hypothetical protein JSCD8_35020 [Clostridioides difficile]
MFGGLGGFNTASSVGGTGGFSTASSVGGTGGFITVSSIGGEGLGLCPFVLSVGGTGGFISCFFDAAYAAGVLVMLVCGTGG